MSREFAKNKKEDKGMKKQPKLNADGKRAFGMRDCLAYAAGDLGCNSLKVMTKVIFPLSRSGVISGITMVFVPSISTFYISQKLGGPSTLLIGDVIEQSYNASNYHLAAALSFVLMVILLIGLAVVNKYTDDDSGGMLI